MLKRKIKNSFRIFILLFLLFLVTLISLFVITQINRSGKFVSPIPFSSKTKPTEKDHNTSLQDVEKLLNTNKISFISVKNWKNSAVVINLQNDRQVELSTSKDISTQITSLQLIIERLTIEGDTFKCLDFRFDRPVIDFEKTCEQK